MFKSKEHENFFRKFEKELKPEQRDCYHLPVIYLLSLDYECRKHYADVFDFKNDCIKIDGLNKAWQTGTSMKTTRLLFNLWNGYHGEEASGDYTPEALFACGYAPFYWQAIKMRYPNWAE